MSISDNQRPFMYISDPVTSASWQNTLRFFTRDRLQLLQLNANSWSGPDSANYYLWTNLMVNNIHIYFRNSFDNIMPVENWNLVLQAFHQIWKWVNHYWKWDWWLLLGTQIIWPITFFGMQKMWLMSSFTFLFSREFLAFSFETWFWLEHDNAFEALVSIRV